MVAQVRSILGQHESGIRVSRADLQVSHPLIPATGHATILCCQLPGPVMALGILLAEFFTLLW
jgi:hypothetical protein